MIGDLPWAIPVFLGAAALGWFVPPWTRLSAGVALWLLAGCFCGQCVVYPSYPSRAADIAASNGMLLATAAFAVGVTARAVRSQAHGTAVFGALLALFAGWCAGQGFRDAAGLRWDRTGELLYCVGDALCSERTKLPARLDDLTWPCGTHLDGWGAPLVYERSSDTTAVLWSAGPDGAIGTSDDVTWRVPEDCARVP